MALTDRRVLVTGASSGIGRAVAIMLAKLGAQVVLVARNEERLQETLTGMSGAHHQVIPFDLTALDSIESIFVRATADGRKLSGLVHAAGVAPMVPLQALTPKTMQDVLTINYSAFLLLAKNFSKKKFCDGGSLVGISSVLAVVGQPGMSAYCGSKGALDAAVRALALELVGRGIRVNSVQPGYIRTNMYAEARQSLSDESQQRIAAKHPMGLGEPDDVAHAVAFLLSDAARLITGSALVVDGGFLA